MKFVYGPVPSRRLGRSLGVNLVPFKTCTYSCAYCQLGRTTTMTCERQDFFERKEIINELETVLKTAEEDIDYVTFAGEGEPTLCKSLGLLIQETKGLTDIPIAVITNSSLLYREDVRQELTAADVIMPSLDAGTLGIFKIINHPHRSIRFYDMVEGLIAFRKEFKGLVWLEVMLVKGINDSDAELQALRAIIDRIGPDTLFINVPIRPPAESWVVPPDRRRILAAKVILGETVTLTEIEQGEIASGGFDTPEEAILTIIRRHPMREEQVLEVFERYRVSGIQERVDSLARGGKILRHQYQGTTFWLHAEEDHK